MSSNGNNYFIEEIFFQSSSILTSTIIRNLVNVYSDQERNRESQLPSGVEPRPSDQYSGGSRGGSGGSTEPPFSKSQ